MCLGLSFHSLIFENYLRTQLEFFWSIAEFCLYSISAGVFFLDTSIFFLFLLLFCMFVCLLIFQSPHFPKVVRLFGLFLQVCMNLEIHPFLLNFPTFWSSKFLQYSLIIILIFRFTDYLYFSLIYVLTFMIYLHRLDLGLLCSCFSKLLSQVSKSFICCLSNFFLYFAVKPQFFLSSLLPNLLISPTSLAPIPSSQCVRAPIASQQNLAY